MEQFTGMEHQELLIQRSLVFMLLKLFDEGQAPEFKGAMGKLFSLMLKDVQVGKLLLGVWIPTEELWYTDVRLIPQYWIRHQILNDV